MPKAKVKPKPRKIAKPAKKKEKPQIEAYFDQSNEVYDVVRGESGKKNALSVLNKKVLDSFEMEDLFLE